MDPSAQIDLEVKPCVWFVDRELGFKPVHFVKAVTPANSKAIQWILNSLSGRFFLEKSYDDVFDEKVYPSFEDPAEATLYELKWS